MNGDGLRLTKKMDTKLEISTTIIEIHKKKILTTDMP